MDAVVPNIEELLKNLNHQLGLYRQLLDLVRAERECIVGVKIKELREHTYSKEALVDEITREESRRVHWLKEASRALQIPFNDLTMDILAKRLAPERFEALMSLKNTMLVLVKRVREHNADNKRLIEVALKDAQEMKKNILGLTSDQPKVYGPSGQMGGASADKGARFISKEA